MELFYGKYQKERLLGRGAFSEVWLVTDVKTGVEQALKIYSPLTNTEEGGAEMMKHEFALMANANHQNLQRAVYFDICDGQPFLVLSYCKNGNIKNKIGKFTERDAWKLLRDSASGLAYLHSMIPPVIHQDIKPDNILIADNGSYMLTDFGVSVKAKATMSRMANDGEKMLQSAGTLPYMAPERFSKDNRPIMAGDIWSLGATVYEMLSGYLPFCQGELQGGLLQKMGADIPELQGDFSQELKDILSQCLSATPWERPTAEQLVEIATNALKKTVTETASAVTTASPIVQSSSIDINPTEPQRISQTKRQKKYVFLIICTVMVLALPFYLLKPLFVEEQKEEKTQKQTTAVLQKPIEEPQPVIAEGPLKGTVENAAEEDKETSKEAVKHKNKVVLEVKRDVPKTAPKNEESRLIKTNLSYGNWSGTVSNGKPYGIGTLSFVSAATINCTNGTTLYIQPDDKLEDAEFDEYGNLYQAKWIKHEGQIKMIMP